MDFLVLFPVYNEERRLERGIRRTVSFLRGHTPEDCDVRLMIVDNASDDGTKEIGPALEKEYPEVRYERIKERGVGAAFRHGISLCEADVAGYMDVDLSTDLKHLAQTIRLFSRYPELDYVNGTRFHPRSVVSGRKPLRRFTSLGLRVLLKLLFGMRVTDAVCGFTFVRTEAAKRLIDECYPDNGWFYMIEFLLRAERDGMRIKDLPVRWREDYDSTVNVGPTIINYLKQMVRLKRTFYEEGH